MSLMVVNPSKRKKPKKRRTAAQKAATRKMIAANKRRARPARSSKKRKSNPIRTHAVTTYRPRATAKRSSKSRRRNPINMGRASGNMGALIFNGLKGAAGGLSINAACNYMPTVMIDGKVLYLTRTVLALALGTLGSKVKVLKKHARPMAEGALAINFADLANSLAGAMIPGTQLHGSMGEYMSQYLSGVNPGQPYTAKVTYPNAGVPLDRQENTFAREYS